MDYRNIELEKPFFILHKDPKKQDITVWCATDRGYGNIGLNIYFHAEGFWCNPPTDSSIEWRATKAIEKYGIIYLPQDYVDGYKKAPWNKKNEYRQLIAANVLSGVGK